MFLELMEQLGIEPNFFCSEEYFEKAEFEEIEDENFCWIEYEGGLMFPPLPLFAFDFSSTNRIWLGLEGLEIPTGWERVFFDYEFIYSPKDFLNLAGGKWQTFRKNIRKFPKRYEKQIGYYDSEVFLPTEEEIMNLFLSWADRSPESSLHDPDIILSYLLEGDNRAFLVDEDGRLLGINCWDYNWRFINFRFCFHDSSFPFLSEYLRYLFYTSETILNDGRLVNDGGSLDSPELYAFKSKLNPVKIRKMYGWRKGTR